MTARAHHFEAGVDLAAAALLGAASAYMLLRFGFAPYFAAFGAAVALAGAWRLLRAVEPDQPNFALDKFDAAPFDFAEPALAELVLADADRLRRADSSDELLLVDSLAPAYSDARVVRLFGAAAMPAPDQLTVRADRPSIGTNPPTAPPDASQALYEALAELRRSLRQL